MSSEELVRRLLLPYESLRTLHEGASEVRLYRNTITDTNRVGKRVSMMGLDETEALLFEARTLQSIDHANVLRVLDVAKVTDMDPSLNVVEMTLPFLPRGSVCDAFERGERFSVGEACALAMACLRGFSELHDVQRVLHRDVKSPNLFLADDGSGMKVGDLSVAVGMEADDMAVALQEPMMYTAPEVFTVGRVGRSADLYGVGLVFFELLNGPFPYDDATYERFKIEERLRVGRRGLLDKHLRHRPYVPDQLRRVVSRAIHRDVSRRFQRANAMSNAIAKARFIDWRLVTDEPDSKVWEGTAVQRRGEHFRVEASRGKRGAFRVSGTRKVSKGWRRIAMDQIVPTLDDPSVRGIFDEVSAFATRR